MCTNGVNTAQLKASVEQINEVIALSRRWTHRAYHLADNASMDQSAAHLNKIQNMLDDLRAELDEVQDSIDRDDRAFASGSVTAV